VVMMIDMVRRRKTIGYMYSCDCGGFHSDIHKHDQEVGKKA